MKRLGAPDADGAPGVPGGQVAPPVDLELVGADGLHGGRGVVAAPALEESKVALAAVAGSAAAGSAAAGGNPPSAAFSDSRCEKSERWTFESRDAMNFRFWRILEISKKVSRLMKCFMMHALQSMQWEKMQSTM